MHNNKFQVIKITFNMPDGSTKDIQFMGPAAFTPEEWNTIKKQPLGAIIAGIAIGDPEDPMTYVESDPKIKDLVDGIQELQSEYQQKSEE